MNGISQESFIIISCSRLLLRNSQPMSCSHLLNPLLTLARATNSLSPKFPFPKRRGTPLLLKSLLSGHPRWWRYGQLRWHILLYPISIHDIRFLYAADKRGKQILPAYLWGITQFFQLPNFSTKRCRRQQQLLPRMFCVRLPPNQPVWYFAPSGYFQCRLQPSVGG